MLHLIFAQDGLNRIKSVLRPNDMVVQVSKDRIFLLDTHKYLKRIQALTSKERNAQENIKATASEGKTINHNQLASIIAQATAIKTIS